MTDQLYHQPLPREAQLSRSQQRRAQLAAQGRVDSDLAAVTQVSADPGQRLLRGQFRGVYAEMMATEIESLFASDGIETVPFFRRGGGPVDGYYSLENVSLDPPTAPKSAVQQYDGRLTRKGSRDSHYRAIFCSPTSVSNLYGGLTEALVGLSTRASDVRWHNPDDGTTTAASAVATNAGTNSNYNIYDALAPGFDRPVLVYQIDYPDEYGTDVRVWDDRNRNFSETINNNTGATVKPAWERVFTTDRQFDGDLHVDTGAIELIFGNTLSVNGGSLNSSSYSLTDWALLTIDQARVIVRATFSDGSNSTPLDFRCVRGRDAIQITETPNTLFTSNDLKDKFDPIAAAEGDTAAAETGIIPRTEVDG